MFKNVPLLPLQNSQTLEFIGFIVQRNMKKVPLQFLCKRIVPLRI